MAIALAHHDSQTRSELEALQTSKLAALLRAILSGNPFYKNKLKGLDAPAAVDDFPNLPFTTRAELQQNQLAHPPYGNNLTYPVGDYSRLHQTSGSAGQPLRVLDRAEDWQWWKKCWATIYQAAGVTSEDRIIFPFSFGPFIGFWAAFESATALGNLCLPAGGMTTAARLRMLGDHEATVVCCTPTYALRLIEVAREQTIDLAAGSVRALILAGEPGGSLPATREAIEQGFGARVFDHAGMSEIGPYGFECTEAPGGMHIMEDEFIAEVIDPQTQVAVKEGQQGELVLTNLGRLGWPLIRYRTGDLVKLSSGTCACGRSFARAEGGILGRIDDMFFIRGNNVYPSVVEDIVRGVPGIAEFQLKLDCRGPLSDLTIEVETTAGDADAIARRLQAAVQDRLHFKPNVCTAPPGTLPRYEMKARRLIKT